MKKIFLMVLIISTLSFSSDRLQKFIDSSIKQQALEQLFSSIKTKNNIYAQSLLEPKKEINPKSYNIVDDKEKNKQTIDINWKDEKGYDAVTVAVIYNNLEMLKYLLSKGANFNYYSIAGRTILVLAIENGSTKVADYLIENHKKMINMPCLNDGWLPIQEAVLKENKKILLKLLRNGAEIRKKDNNGYDVYDLATRHGKGVMVKIIRDYELGILK